ncbi:MAG: prepilin-type N-terminal cleavage/methylation domain-containing protein [Acetobacterium woodii]|nr:prepilin-type N-terminal cleavage/methylation domain-containing protein [Acetobacterium woodii]
MGGFTLVELIVSMALFTVVVFITTSAFLNLSRLYKKASVTRAAMDTLNIAMENMTRNLRTATLYNCGADQSYISSSSGYGVGAVLPPRDCALSGSTAISFMSPNMRIGTYQLSIPQQWEIDENGILYPYIKDVPPGFSCCEVLTAYDEIYITNLKFYVIGADSTSGTTKQPRVNIVIQGYVPSDPDKTKFSIYTSVTQRSPK